jgi:hypothetical protein
MPWQQHWSLMPWLQHQTLMRAPMLSPSPMLSLMLSLMPSPMFRLQMKLFVLEELRTRGSQRED